MSDPPSVAKDKAGAALPRRFAPWLAAAAAAAFWTRWRSKAPPAATARPQTPADFEIAEPARGRTARYPWQIPRLGWKDVLWRTWREVNINRLPALAGGVTYFLLLATFPAIAAFVSLYGLFSDVNSVERQLVGLSSIFPRDAVDLIGAQMLRLATQRHGTLGAAFAVSTLLSAWSANAGMKSLFDGVNLAYGEVEKRDWLRRSLITYGATLAGLGFLAAITAVTVGAPVVFRAAGFHEVRFWWTPLRWLVVYLLVGVAFSLIYRYGPSRAPAHWRWVAPGGFAAALFWIAASLGFSAYVNNFTHLGVTYGSLGAMIAFMLWIWVSVMVVLFGAELNAEIEHQTAHDTTIGSPLPLGRRGAAMADSVGKAFTVSPREARDYVLNIIDRQIDYTIDFLKRLVGL